MGIEGNDMSNFHTEEQEGLLVYESSRGFEERSTQPAANQRMDKKFDHQNEQCDCYGCAITAPHRSSIDHLGLGKSMQDVWTQFGDDTGARLPGPEASTSGVAPEHYKLEGGLQTIDYILATLGSAGFVAYCRGNAFKYISRSCRRQDTTLKDLEDIKKAIRYLQWIVELEETCKITHE